MSTPTRPDIDGGPPPSSAPTAGTLAESTRVRVLVDMPAARLWDRHGTMSGAVAAGTEGQIVQPVVIRPNGSVWIACHSEWSRDAVAGVDGYEVICEVPHPRLTARRPDGSEGPLMEEVWAYAPAGALEAIRPDPSDGQGRPAGSVVTLDLADLTTGRRPVDGPARCERRRVSR